MKRLIHYGEEKIAFTINFLPRPQRRVTINVMPDGDIRVDAPEDTEPLKVVSAVHKRVRWIWQQLHGQSERKRHVLPREYVSGECHYYLGRRHVLKVTISSTAEPGVKLLRGKLVVTARKRDASQIRDLLEAWYRERASEVFARRIADCISRIHWIKTEPSFRLLRMRTQWGSCSPQGELVLNPLLVKAPRTCIDYVIVHELCHLREHNHSVEYYRLLSAAIPDWQARKQELDDMAERMLNR
ncbi:MAG: metal-dependent hydrolase [Proteobacteria bacterium]|nr:metal-dependent hydrolase [Pseudomonadota bacterium]